MNFHKFMATYIYNDFSKNWDPFAFIPITFYIQSRDSPMISELLAKY